MKRRDFIKGSAILGMTVSNSSLITANSGMYHGKGQRKIYRILNSDRVNVGTLPVMRAFAGDQNDHVSPFVLFDEFGPVNLNAGDDPLRVDAHPHAGVTPTTYFNSGSGAIHMEESGEGLYKEGGVYHGFQIWLNTPSQYKFMDPTTLVHRLDDMGKIETDDYSINVVLGELGDAKSKIEMLTPAFFYHVKMKDNGRLDIPTDPTHNAFIYQIKGSIELIDAKKLETNQVVLYERGDSIINIYSECESEFLVLGGLPLDEVVYSYGPFVMNTQEQINQCIRNYRSGLMGNPELVNL